MIIGIKRGAEKGASSAKAGDIVYWPMGDSLVIFPRDARPYGPVNKVGAITENLELFRDLRGGVEIRIEQIAD